MIPSIKIILPDEGWVEKLARLHGKLFSPPWLAEDFVKFIRNKTDQVLLAFHESDHNLAGFIVIRSVIDEAEILTLGVDPEYRNQGIGKLLCKSAIDTAEKNGVNKVFLEVREDNEEALRIYKSLEFEIVSRRNEYYNSGSDHQSNNGIVMKRSTS